MTEAKVVYVVTAGDHSDYHIEGVFSSKENAEAFIASPVGRGEVEEWSIDLGMDAVEEHLRPIFIAMDRNGNLILSHSPSFLTGYEWSRKPPELVGDVMKLTVLARDRQHAVKIANEKRVQLIAMNQWEAPK